MHYLYKMGITTSLFFVFITVLTITYYVLPQKARWIVLLAGSYLFYLYASKAAVVFIIVSTLITYVAARLIDRINQSESDREVARAHSKWVLIPALVLNLGILAVLKYTGFIVLNINNIFNAGLTLTNMVLPLGISYYTFQSVGYVMDVYWNRARAEKNPAKYALFVVFFPQLVQGPIGRYSSLAHQLIEGHKLDPYNIRYGITRIIWGLFKKMVLADWAAIYRDAIFSDPDGFSGIAIFGVLFYTVELYCDFSGGIDIVIGVAQLFGVTMDENFNQPFFAVSLSNFWQRWHISLGLWMKDYVLIPLSGAKWMKKFGKFSKKAFGKKTGRLIPVSVTNLLVFLIVGIWHGADWGNILWGVYNGVIIAASTLLSGFFISVKARLKINDEAKWWKVFSILRTFAIVNLSWYFDCADSFGKAFKMIGYSFTRSDLSLFMNIPAGNLGKSYTPYALLTIGIGAILLFIFGLLRERGSDLLKILAASKPVLQYVVVILFLVSIPLFGPMQEIRGFLYAQF